MGKFLTDFGFGEASRRGASLDKGQDVSLRRQKTAASVTRGRDSSARLDLAQLDPETTQLYLRVPPAVK